MIRHWQSPAAHEVGRNAEEFLRLLGGPAWIHLPGHDRARTRAVTTLLHGNEPSGLRALHGFLAGDRTPATDVLALVASVEAALAPPGFANRMLPGRKDLNRCFADRGTDADAQLAREILDGLRAARPEALVDLHNTSGAGPAYGVGTRAGPRHLALTAAFAPFFVLTDLLLGALMEAVEEDFPMVTIECGGARSARSDEVAADGLARYVCADDLFTDHGAASRVSVLAHPIRVQLANGGDVAYANSAVASRRLTLRGDIDRFNSTVLVPTEPIGWATGLEMLTARDGNGLERLGDLLEIRAGQLFARRPLRLFMATTDARIAAADCLFYAVFCGGLGDG
jgi:Succinylglutamate desuccinylase / Aspartoacylase family